MKRGNVEDVYKLSPVQQGMLFHSLYAPETGAYFDQFVIPFGAKVDLEAFEQAWRDLVARHTALRTTFLWEDLEEPVQVVHRRVEVPFRYEDWSHLDPDEHHRRFAALCREDRGRGFDLTRPPLLRLILVRGPDAMRLVISYHHLILDGWSMGLILGEFQALLAAARGGDAAPLPPARPFGEYVRWLSRQDLPAAESYWRETLAGFRVPVRLGIDLAATGAPAGEDRGLGHSRTTFSADETEELRRLASRHRLTLHTLVEAAWALTLRRYGAADDLVYGLTVSGRPAALKNVQAMVGCFINTLPVRVRIDPSQSLAEWLRVFQSDHARLRKYEYSPLNQVQKWSEVPAGVPLFETIVVSDSFVEDQDFESFQRTNYPLALVIVPRRAGLMLSLSYDRGRFEEAAIGRVRRYLRALLERFLADGLEAAIGALPELVASERAQLLVEWNEARPDYRAAGLAHELVAHHAERSPARLAAVFEDEALSYGELARRSRRLARHLRAAGAGPETLVGVLLESSLELAPALVGVLETGAGYLPLDPSYPEERLSFMIEDSGAAVVVSEERFARLVPAGGPARIDLGRALAAGPAAPLERPAATPENPAYVIYTSGSTGKPKGVVVPHRALVNRLRFNHAADQGEAPLRYLQFTPISFDMSVNQTFAPLSSGGCLVLARSEGRRDPAYLARRIATERVTHAGFPPLLLGAMLEGPELAGWEALVHLVTGGEAVPAELPRRVYAKLPHTRLHNRYGPTEATVAVTSWHCRRGVDERPLPIGRPIARSTIYLLDGRLRPVPLGLTGELYVGGPSLARGYLHRPALTAASFLPHPAGDGERLYRTGDLARYRGDGALLFAGRVDHQVKIRGFRIELGEIEAALRRHPGVRQAAVVDVDDGQARRLAAYVVPASGAALDAAEMAAGLRAELPEYMVPAAFVTLDALPLLPSGKVDRRALPAPVWAPEDEGDFVAPRNTTEETLAEIWRAVLKLERVGVEDNFFALGGDSILSIQVVNRAHRAGLELHPRQVFEHPTIAELAAAVGSGPAIDAEQGPVTGDVPLTPIQRWFFEQRFEAPHHWNQAMVFELRRRLEPRLLDAALAALLRQHDALRMRFETAGGGVRQACAEPGGAPPATTIDLAGLPADRRPGVRLRAADQAQASLDLASGPLLRAALFELGDAGQELLLAVHHLVVDGVSWRVLADDLELACEQLAAGDPVDLGRKSSSYKRWAELLVEHVVRGGADAELAHWRRVASTPEVELPADRPDGANRVALLRKVTATLDADVTDKLLRPAREAYRTEIDELLLAALARTLGRFCGASEVRLALESHGREPIDDRVDVSRTVGWFTALYPVALPGGGEDPGELIQEVKERLRAVPAKGLGYGLLRYLHPDADLRAELAAAGEPPVSFNYLGQLDALDAGDALFALSGAPPGALKGPRNHRDRELSIDALVASGRLRVEWSYASGRYDRATVEELAETFLRELEALVAHCLEPGAGAYTPSDFPLAGLDREALARAVGDARDVEALYPLSPMQEGMLFHTLVAPASGAYFEQRSTEIGREVDPELFERAWNLVVARHPSLRAALVWEGLERPLQRVHRDVELRLERHDLSDTDDAESEEKRLAELLEADRQRGFDLRRAPLMRLAWITLPGGRRRWLWSFHHVLLDGWSGPLVLGEVMHAYEALAAGERPVFEPVQPYERYIAWLERRDGSRAEEFWRRYLAGFRSPTALEIRRRHLSEAELRSSDHASRWRPLGRPLDAALAAAARDRRLTLNTLVQGAWALLLARYGGRGDVVFGVTVSGRPAELPGVEAMVGVFINTLPVRVRVDERAALGEWLEALQAQQVEMRSFETTPLVAIQGWSELGRGRALFESLLLFESAPVKKKSEGESSLQMGELRGFERTNYPLTLTALPRGPLTFGASFDAREFEPEAVERMLGHLENLLGAMVEDPGRRLGELPLLGREEERQVLHGWNDTGRELPARPLLHELFAARAAEVPERLAVVAGDDRLPYGELARRVDRLVARLAALGVGPEARVGVCLERSAEMVVALLAVLRAGGAYVPLDPAYPRERIAYVLEDAGVAALLTEERVLERLSGIESRVDAPVVRLGGGDREAPESATPAAAARPAGLAYVIYTSGSTGRPKGVQIPHRALVNFLLSMAREPGFGAGDRLAAVTTPSFDIAALELYLPLLAGGRTVIAPAEIAADGPRLARLLEAEGVTVMQATPATWQVLVESGWRGDGRLKVLAGGEALPRRLATRLLDAGGELWNLYGPTETTVWSAALRVTAGDGPVEVGGPIANTELYVGDRRLRSLPVAVPGELLIGGAGLARGYFGRPALTAERFLPDPWSGRAGARLYATGDLVRRRPVGTFEFLGRLDHQVKVRGFRIELGEIEARLVEHPAIAEAVVAARGEAAAERRLVAYLVTADGALPGAAELRRHLTRALPDYMVPQAYVELESLPLTPNGKVDRRALPEPDAGPAAAAERPPASELERAIAEVWRQVLEVEAVGAEQNFFDLGGHSLLMVRVHGRLRELLDRDLPMIDLFRYPTVRSLARHLSAAGRAPELVRRRAVAASGPDEDGRGVAIVGMAGRFPGAASVEEFWQNLRAGRESIVRLSDEELLEAGVPESVVASPDFVKVGAGLRDAERFDAAFFDYSPREAQVIDPQQRVFLECAWEALEDAGYPPETVDGDVGVYAGAGMNTYLLNLVSNPQLMQAVGAFQAFVSNDKDFLPTRVSYKLDLKGPSVNVQTACSTSLVAVSMACEHLLSGKADLALAGGVSINPARKMGYWYQEGGILSPDGHTRAFDRRAGGAVFGDGAGVVVLKRLDDALRDGDSVHAVIRGAAINNDGSLKVGFTAPSVEGQARAIAQAQAEAGVAPETVGYVETHGTATPMGDPIEVTALMQAFAAGAAAGAAAGGGALRPRSCAIGSVKTNIGHVDTAAGVAGLIKAALAVEHGEIPPSLHFEQPNEMVDFDAGPFYVNTELRPWEGDGHPRRAGVSSFGIGGTNAHVILEEAPPVPDPDLPRPYQLLVLSARTRGALEAMSGRLADHLERHPEQSFADVAYTLQVGRRRFPHRRMLVCRDRDDALAELRRAGSERLVSAVQAASERPVVFLFPGGGAQYVGMGRDLYRSEPVFRDAVDRCAELSRPHLGFDFREVLYAEGDEVARATARLRRTLYALPALFATEYALARLWMSRGVRPQAMIGHSLGEYVAACLAEAISLPDALAVVAARSRLFEELPEGAMLSVALSSEELEPLLGGELSIAASNTPSLSVASGPVEAIDALERELAARDVEHRRLHIDVAAHSTLIEAILEPFREALAGVEQKPPRIPYVTNVTGTWITDEEAVDREHWPRHLRRTVRFAEGLGEVLRDPERVLLEVGPGQTLSTLARQHPGRDPKTAVLSSLRHPKEAVDDREFLLGAQGKLWLLGAEVDWRAHHAGERRRRVPLPTYPFERQRYYVEAAGPMAFAGRGSEVAPAELAPSEHAPAEEAVEDRPEILGEYVAPRGPVEERLAGWWSELLGIGRIGVHDNFFELGGSSLMAIQLRSRLRKHFDAELPPHFLLEAPTVARLAELVGGEAAAESPYLVEIEPGDRERPPLCLVHPVGGQVYFYRALAAKLGGGQPVWGLQARGFDEGEALPASLAELAAEYVAAIRARRPAGPYLLGGSSMGGTIAWEMAQQLRAAGEEVALLVLIDTPGPGEMPERSRDDAELLMRLYGDQLPLEIDELRALEPERQLARVLELARGAGALPPDFELADARRHLDVVKALLEAFLAYRPGPYPGEVLFFSAAEKRPGDPPRPERAWEGLAGALETHRVPGDHVTMLHPENVGEMAAHLRRAIAAALAGGRRRKAANEATEVVHG